MPIDYDAPRGARRYGQLLRFHAKEWADESGEIGYRSGRIGAVKYTGEDGWLAQVWFGTGEWAERPYQHATMDDALDAARTEIDLGPA